MGVAEAILKSVAIQTTRRAMEYIVVSWEKSVLMVGFCERADAADCL
jgi:hypothetical protein